MTLEEIAKELGVSKSTVSRALSGKGRIGEETRNKIYSYAKECGYATKKEIRLNLSKTKNIGVIIPSDAYEVTMPFFQECLLGICECTLKQDYNVVIGTHQGYDISGIKQLVENKKVDGIILMRNLEDDIAVKYLIEKNIPVSIVGTCGETNVIQVDSDNRVATESLVQMLVARGYERFALLLGDFSYRVNRERYEGYREGIMKAGLSNENQAVYKNVIDQQDMDDVIYSIMMKKIQHIICGDDVICTKIVSKLQSEGYKIPEQIAVASLYNSTNLECFSPPITTVNVSAKLLGNMAAKQLIQCLEGKEYNRKTNVDYEILFRKSTGRVS